MQKRRLEVHEGKPGMCPGEPGVQRHRPAEHLARGRVVLAIEAIHVLKANMIRRPGVEIVTHGKLRHAGLVLRDAEFEGNEYSRRDLGAKRVHVIDPAGEPVRPDDAAVAGVHQLDGHHEVPADHLGGALEAVANAEQPAHFEGVGIGTAHSERRRARRHQKPA